MSKKSNEPFVGFEYEIDNGKTINFYPNVFEDIDEEDYMAEFTYPETSKKDDKEIKDELTQPEQIEKLKDKDKNQKQEQATSPTKRSLREAAKRLKNDEQKKIVQIDDGLKEIKEDLKYVLSELDKLFADLPENNIMEFARSDVFNKYNIILDYFGL